MHRNYKNKQILCRTIYRSLIQIIQAPKIINNLLALYSNNSPIYRVFCNIYVNQIIHNYFIHEREVP